MQDNDEFAEVVVREGAMFGISNKAIDDLISRMPTFDSAWCASLLRSTVESTSEAGQIQYAISGCFHLARLRHFSRRAE